MSVSPYPVHVANHMWARIDIKSPQDNNELQGLANTYDSSIPIN